MASFQRKSLHEGSVNQDISMVTFVLPVRSLTTTMVATFIAHNFILPRAREASIYGVCCQR
jgi:hypothetical protein